MRCLLVMIVVFICISGLAVPGYCGCGCKSNCVSSVATNDCSGNALQKLGRGIANCMTFPMEVPSQMGRVNVTDGPFASCTYGLLKGLGMAGLRVGVGIYEVLTFPVPCPPGYAPILRDPEYFFEDQMF